MALIADGNAACVKVEGGSEYALKIASAIAQAGIPVVGNFNMPSAFVDKPGAYQSWAANSSDVGCDERNLVVEGLRFEAAGCCALVLSKILPEIAQDITQSVRIPTIGIGSGANCDGQILVLEDLLGLTQRDHPYYVKKYAQFDEIADKALRTYLQEVRQAIYPDDLHSRPH